jgi:hypothetical protein
MKSLILFANVVSSSFKINYLYLENYLENFEKELRFGFPFDSHSLVFQFLQFLKK